MGLSSPFRIGLRVGSTEGLSLSHVSARPRLFSGAALLTRILGGAGQPGEMSGGGRVLSEALTSGRARNLSDAFQQLNPSDREALQNRWGRSLAEIESLSQERDPQIFYAGLLQIGQRLEDNDQLEQAGIVYSAIVADNSPHPPLILRGGEDRRASPRIFNGGGGEVPPLRIRGGQEGLSPVPAGIRNRAQVRFNAMTGAGASGERIAFLARRISTEATRPDMLLAMGAAGAAFRLTRLATTARLAGTLETTWGLRAVAYGSGFLAETLAFTGVGKVAGQAFGYQQNWSPEAILHEWAGGATMLLGLKLTGALAGAAGGRWARGTGPLERFTQGVLPQLGMFGGIVLGNRLEEAAGFRTSREGDTWLVDGLSTLLQFNVAGRLQSAALGEGFASFERRLDLHAEMLSRPSLSSRGGANLADSIRDFLTPDLVTPEGILLPSFENRKSKIENLSRPLFMIGEGNGNGGDQGDGGGSGRKPAIPPPPEGDSSPGTLRIGTPRSLDAAKREEAGPGDTALEAEFRLRETRPEGPEGADSEAEVEAPRITSDLPIRIPLFTAGTLLGPGKRYEVVDHLGRGGSGDAYRAVDRKYGRSVVLKVPRSLEEAEDRQRLEREIWIGANLGSTWAATVYDHFELYKDSKINVQVIEYVAGEELAFVLRQYDRGDPSAVERFPLARRIEVIAELSVGIEDAHSKGITHDDVKPDNVMIDEQGRVRILDWGQAKYQGDTSSVILETLPPEALERRPQHETRPGMKGGTLGYMAPEYASSVRPENPFLVDEFSLGVTLWEALAEGKHPFGFYSENPEAEGPRLIPRRDPEGRIELNELGSVFYGASKKIRPPRLADVVTGRYPSYFSELEAVALRAMSPKPADRYPSVREFREALLMAQPRTLLRELRELKESIRSEYDRMNQEWVAQGDGREIPPGKWGNLHGPVEALRQKHKRWERGVDRLLNHLSGLTGGEPAGGDWPEAHRMIAELNWELLNDQVDFHPRDVRADLIEQIRLHDTPTETVASPSLRISLEEKVPLPFHFQIIRSGEEISENFRFRLFPFLRDSDLSGIEFGTFREGHSRWEGDLRALRDLRIPAGYHILDIQHPQFAPMRLPLRLGFEDIRRVVEGGATPFPVEVDLIPSGRVDEGSVVIPGGTATIGLNIFGHENIITAYSFPERRIPIRPMAITRDPITVADYWNFVNEVFTTQGREAAEKLIPRIYRSNPARTIKERMKAGFWAARNEEKGFQLFWNFEDRGRRYGEERYVLQKPTSYLDQSQESLKDPNGDPIYLEQPTSSITFQMAEEFMRWRALRKNKTYRIPEIFELEAITRNFFPMNFPWGNVLDPSLVVSRHVFADKRLTYPQPVGTHPLDTFMDRDFTVFGTRGHLGNVREFSATPGEKNTISIFGGSIGVIPGPLYYPASRNWLVVDRPVPGVGAFRLVEDF